MWQSSRYEGGACNPKTLLFLVMHIRKKIFLSTIEEDWEIQSLRAQSGSKTVMSMTEQTSGHLALRDVCSNAL